MTIALFTYISKEPHENFQILQFSVYTYRVEYGISGLFWMRIPTTYSSIRRYYTTVLQEKTRFFSNMDFLFKYGIWLTKMK